MTTAPAPAASRSIAGAFPSSRLALACDALEAAWARGWADRPSLEPEVLIRAARRKTGIDEVAGGCWRGRLDLLSEALVREAALTPLGLTIAHGQLVSALANRLRADALWRRHPEIADQPIAAPVIVLGHMRSGSTRMQRLLACDPRLRFTRFFESWNPLPGRLLDDRRARGWLALRIAGLFSPEFGTIHPTATAAPDEETGLHNVSIFGSAFEAQWRVPSFARAGEAADRRPVYAEFRRLLQTIAWLRRDRTARPWVLKMPQLMQDLDAVLEVFPDARLVCLERPGAAVVASSASLVRSQMRVQSDAVDAHWIGRETLRKVALRERRSRTVRAWTGAPQVTVRYDDVGADWRGEMARVYAMLGLPLTERVARRMARYVARQDHRRLAAHRYALSEFGLSEAEVARALA